MGNKKVVVKVESGITASLMQDFWRKVGDGTINGKGFHRYLENPHQFDDQNSVTLVRAINILRQDKVITNKQAAKAWQLDWQPDAPIRYDEATIRFFAEQNKFGADWRLIFYLGLSLREQREERGINQDCQPCFYNNDWWLKPAEDNWATKKMEAGYYLINLVGQFSNMSWNQQEPEIAKLGDKYDRCHEAIFSEAILTIFMINNGEQIAENWYHCGVSVVSSGYHVGVGRFDAEGFKVNIHHWDEYDGHPDLRVSVARKFDY